mgnify:CR=1 FL=1
MSNLFMYASCASMYGSMRAGFRVADMDVLPGTKIATIVASGLYAPVLLPIYILNDMNRGYMIKYGLDYTKYGYPEKDKHIGDVLFR